MEVRCSSCNKLFRVSDEKIVGSGVKFGCTRCGSTVKITREEFEHYRQLTRVAVAAAPAPAVSAAPSFQPAAPIPPVHAVKKPQADEFDLSEPAQAAVQQEREEEMPVFAQSSSPQPAPPSHPAAPVPRVEARQAATVPPKRAPSLQPAAPSHPAAPGPKVEPRQAAPIPQKPASPPQPKAVPAAPARPKQDQVQARPASPASPAAVPPPARETHRPTLPAAESAVLQPAPSSGFGKKVLMLIVVLIVLGGLGAGAKYYFMRSSQRVSDSVKQATLPDGLQIKNASGTVDPVKQDLIISGIVENATDTPKLAWYILVEVYDAQGAVLTKAKLLNGKQIFTRRDFEIMAKRGENIQEIKTKQLQEPGVIIPAHGSVNFEARILEPPVGIATFNPLLQPFDPVQLFKEMAEEQK